MEARFRTAVEPSTTLKTSKVQVCRLIAQGEIPSARFTRLVRVQEEDFNRFRANHLAPDGLRPGLAERAG